MADLTLSTVQRSILNERTQIANVRDDASHKLATGQRVSRAADDPVDFFRASALTSRVNSLLNVKADIGRGIDTLAATQTGLDAVEKLANQLKGLAYAAEGNADLRDSFAKQFDTVRAQIDLLAADTSFRGTNLLSNPADSLRVSVSDQPGTELTVDGKATDVGSLSIGSAAADYGNFATIADIETAIAAVDAAVTQIRTSAAEIGSSAAILEVREDFTQDLVNVLQSGAEKLISADLNEEGARLLSAGVRDSLAGEAQRIAAQNESAVVQLVSGAA